MAPLDFDWQDAWRYRVQCVGENWQAFPHQLSVLYVAQLRTSGLLTRRHVKMNHAHSAVVVEPVCMYTCTTHQCMPMHSCQRYVGVHLKA